MRAGCRPDLGPAVAGRVSIADVRTIRSPAVPVAVGAIFDRVRRSGLERRDPGDRPPAQHVLPHAFRRARDVPSVKKRQPLAAVEVAQAPIQLQPALSDRYGCYIRGSALGINLADPFAGAIEALRPGIRGRELKSMGEAPVQTRLQ